MGARVVGIKPVIRTGVVVVVAIMGVGMEMGGLAGMEGHVDGAQEHCHQIM
jgi:hypothetical protein